MENKTEGYIIGVRYCLEDCQHYLRGCKCDYKSG